jgi:LysR family transcriptional regulator (chromosome initiation inhibitor)
MLDYSQIEALLAVENEGTFEGAARSLRITSFAVTQRIKLLEKSLGVALIERKPTRTSEAGKVLCEHAREVIALENAVISQPQQKCLEQDGNRRTLKIALNDESISSWFGQVLKDQTKRKDGVRFDVTLTNCDRAIDLMQSGRVTAAVSSRKEPVHGFKSYTLTPATYLSVASPTFIDRYFPDGISKTNLSRAPCLRFCKNDTCAFEWTKQVFGEVLQLTLFKHPSTASLIGNCLNHQAWALAPSSLVDVHLNKGALVELVPGTPLKKPLYWHVAGDMVDDLIHVTKSVRDAASN